MKLEYKKIGDYIELVDKRNIRNEYTAKDLMGIRIDKTFIPSVANVSGTDLSKYKVVEKGMFAFSPMQVGRDKAVRVVLYQNEEPAIISPAYLTFAVKDREVLLPEYLMMNFLRSEMDRYGWFISDGSVRASLDWERFCEIEIPIPPIDKQEVVVKLYNSINQNVEYLKNGLDDLNKITKSFIDDIKVKRPHVKIGQFIEQSDLRNKHLDKMLDKYDVRGISTSKVLIPTNANLNGVKLDSYRVMLKGEFAYVPDTSRRGDKIALALNNDSPCLISSIYTVFKIKDQSKIMPEFLYLWFNRSEFDRYARYHSIGSAREVFSWEDMCDVKVPLPTIEEQRAIVKIHLVLHRRMELIEKYERQVKGLAPILIRGVVEEMNEVNV
ncbi:restriction endonuclease subunit S [Virgibacillus sp. MSJ-26]|uniref:restriction endonuclease subunit S n=1 Tax=Virgibacillus sp. MSJ-26 TaxID=2841522 RepID=UPI001C1026A0|nr:restriction endonuclease subunit S [Virgibacillus sp. MSJ-26]MBU5466242.1 restriction endonuclease subunit S [Virgibacillus sp. MSJ-26]